MGNIVTASKSMRHQQPPALGQFQLLRQGIDWYDFVLPIILTASEESLTRILKEQGFNCEPLRSPWSPVLVSACLQKVSPTVIVCQDISSSIRLTNCVQFSNMSRKVPDCMLSASVTTMKGRSTINTGEGMTHPVFKKSLLGGDMGAHVQKSTRFADFPLGLRNGATDTPGLGWK